MLFYLEMVDNILLLLNSNIICIITKICIYIFIIVLNNQAVTLKNGSIIQVGSCAFNFFTRGSGVKAFSQRTSASFKVDTTDDLAAEGKQTRD